MRNLVNYFAGLILMISGAATALAGLVTFQVNMSSQIALGNFNPATDTVFVAGDPVNGWSPSDSPLAPSAGDNHIWVGTFDVTGAAGNTAQYKFLVTTPSTTTWEGNVGPGGPSGNRVFTLADADQTLPVVYFNNVTSGTTVSGDVTFQINMSVQTELGSFDPSSGTVSVAGEFNSWNPTAFELTPNASEPSVWAGTVKLSGASGSAANYKFVMNGGTWEGNVGPGGAQNRSVSLSNTAQTLPAVYFNNVSSVPKNVPLTFQVNLGVQIAQGNFDPDTDTVAVAGDLLNNWNPSASALERSAADPNLWTGTFEVSGSTGTAMFYKYVLNGSTWEGNVGPDGAQNRTYSLVSTDPQSVPSAYFNNVTNLGALSLGPVSGGQLTLSWTPGPKIWLQTATDLRAGGWQDVPNSLGQGSVTVPVDSSPAFYQLVGP